MSASREVDDGVAMIAKTNMASFPPSARNCRKEMVDNSGDLLSHVGERDAGSMLFVRVASIVLFIQSIFGLWSSNQGRPRTIGCSGLRIMLKEIMLARSPRTILSGSDSSTMSPEAMGRPSMTPTATGLGSLFKRMFCDKANSRSMKQELAPESRRAEARTR